MNAKEFELALQEIEEGLGLELARAIEAWRKTGRDLGAMPMPNGKTYKQCTAEELFRYDQAITHAREARERLKYGAATILHDASTARH